MTERGKFLAPSWHSQFLTCKRIGPKCNVAPVLKILGVPRLPPGGEFCLGLDKIYRLTKSNNRLRVDLEDIRGKTAYAEYDMFAVTSERTKYQLSLGTYSGELMTHRPPKIVFSVLLLSFRKSIKIKNSLCLPIR